MFSEKGRFFVNVAGVAFSITLIMILLGLYRGWSDKITRYVEEVDADVWVLQKGAGDMFHSTSLFPNTLKEKIEDIGGVEKVSLLIGRQISFELKEKDAHLVIMGYDTETGVGGPIEIIKGSHVPKSGEIIVDEVFAKNKDVTIGDTLPIHDNKYKIVGISTGGNLVSFQYAYMPIEDDRKLLQMEDVTNYALISFSENVNQADVIQRIENDVPEIHIMTKSEFADNNKQQITESFLPIIYILVVIGFLVGMAVISLTIYTATIEKAREYGVLKAIGAKPSHLYRIILEQATISGAAGFILSVFLVFVAVSTAQAIQPSFITSFILKDILFVVGISILMIIVSALLPIRRIIKIDPAIVFKT